jgi:hypothetical protein
MGSDGRPSYGGQEGRGREGSPAYGVIEGKEALFVGYNRKGKRRKPCI